MLIYDGVYSWDGNKYPGQNHICWWPGAYNLKIVDCSDNNKTIHLLKPVICIFSNTGEGTSITNCTQNFVKKICQDFNLKIERVLWIEYFPGHKNCFEVVLFKKSALTGKNTLYSVKKRQIMDSEIALLKTYFNEFKQIDRLLRNANVIPAELLGGNP